MTLYDLHATPPLDAPVLLVALEGWIDAGFGAARAAEALVGQSDTTHIATFDADQLLDFRARRPIMHLVDGVNTGLTWSTTELHALTAPNGTDVLLLTGVEPDNAWHRFADSVRDLALDFGCRMQLGFGSYPAGVPHTRPVLLSTTASNEALADTFGMARGTLDVPAGIESVLETRFDAVGVPALGIWSQVPHYAATLRYPAASAKLIEGFNQITGSDFSTDVLAEEIVDTRRRIDSLLADNEDHLAMVRQLEAQLDAQTATQIADLPSGDDLAEELEQFLRDQDTE